MKRLQSFGVFWYDFIIGDDWRIALGVFIGLGLSLIFVHVVRVDAWWLLPIVAIITLAMSLRLAIQPRE